MADGDGTTTTTTGGTDPNAGANTDPNAGTATDTTDWKAEAERWKALSRKNEADKKANADKAKLWDDYQETQKTEAQKLAEAQAAAEKRAADAERQVALFKVAAKHGVPAELLTGSSEEELEASAKSLLEFAGKQKPTPDLGQGNRGSAASADPNAWLRQMARRG